MRTITLFNALALTFALGCGSVSAPPGDDDDADAAVVTGPKVTAVSPEHGPSAGGVTITLTGTGFDNGENLVVVGGRAAADVEVPSDTELTFTLPRGVPDAVVDITVSNDTGFGVLWDAFTFNPRPTITGVTPDIGPGAGGTPLTITGSGFDEGTPAVLVGEEPATNVAVVDDETITADAPALVGRPFEWRNVIVENPNGMAVAEAAFRYTKQGLLFAMRRGDTELDPLGGPKIFFFDLDTHESIELGDLPFTAKGLDIGPDGQLYAMSNGRYPLNAPWLFELDPLTGTASAPTQITSTARPRGMAFSGPLIYAIDRDSYLISIVTSTGASERISAAPMPLTGGPTAVARKDATSLFTIDYVRYSGADNTLDIITIGNGTIASTVDLVLGEGLEATYIYCTGLVLHNGVLYAAARDSSNINMLLSVNPTTGAVTRLAELPTRYAKGLSVTPPDW